MAKTYIISPGKFLPGLPVDNDSMKQSLGVIAGKRSHARQRNSEADWTFNYEKVASPTPADILVLEKTLKRGDSC
jgi:hypothetical protein